MNKTLTYKQIKRTIITLGTVAGLELQQLATTALVEARHREEDHELLCHRIARHRRQCPPARQACRHPSQPPERARSRGPPADRRTTATHGQLWPRNRRRPRQHHHCCLRQSGRCQPVGRRRSLPRSRRVLRIESLSLQASIWMSDRINRIRAALSAELDTDDISIRDDG